MFGKKKKKALNSEYVATFKILLRLEFLSVVLSLHEPSLS